MLVIADADSLFLLRMFLSIFLSIFARISSVETSAIELKLNKMYTTESSQFVVDYFFGNLTYFTVDLGHQTFLEAVATTYSCKHLLL